MITRILSIIKGAIHYRQYPRVITYQYYIVIKLKNQQNTCLKKEHSHRLDILYLFINTTAKDEINVPIALGAFRDKQHDRLLELLIVFIKHESEP